MSRSRSCHIACHFQKRWFHWVGDICEVIVIQNVSFHPTSTISRQSHLAQALSLFPSLAFFLSLALFFLSFLFFFLSFFFFFLSPPLTYFLNSANFLVAAAISASALLMLAALLFSAITAFFFFISSAFTILSASRNFLDFTSAALRSATRFAVSISFCFLSCCLRAFSSLALRSAAIFLACWSFFLCSLAAFSAFFFCSLAVLSAFSLSFLVSK